VRRSPPKDHSTRQLRQSDAEPNAPANPMILVIFGCMSHHHDWEPSFSSDHQSSPERMLPLPLALHHCHPRPDGSSESRLRTIASVPGNGGNSSASSWRVLDYPVPARRRRQHVPCSDRRLRRPGLIPGSRQPPTATACSQTMEVLEPVKVGEPKVNASLTVTP
jgi:hypothetical protein